MNIDMLPTILTALITTIILEMGVLLFLRERRAKVLVGSVVINMLTNVPLSLWTLATYPSWTQVIIAEVLICCIESAAYFLLCRNRRQAIAYGFLCNSISFLTGLVVELLCILLGVYIPLIY